MTLYVLDTDLSSQLSRVMTVPSGSTTPGEPSEQSSFSCESSECGDEAMICVPRSTSSSTGSHVCTAELPVATACDVVAPAAEVQQALTMSAKVEPMKRSLPARTTSAVVAIEGEQSRDIPQREQPRQTGLHRAHHPKYAEVSPIYQQQHQQQQQLLQQQQIGVYQSQAHYSHRSAPAAAPAAAQTVAAAQMAVPGQRQRPVPTTCFDALVSAAPIPIRFRRRSNVGGHSEVIICVCPIGPGGAPIDIAVKMVPVDQPGRKPQALKSVFSAFHSESAVLERITKKWRPTARTIRLVSQPFEATIRSDLARKGSEHGLCCFHFTPHKLPQYVDYCDICCQHKKDHVETTTRVLSMVMDCVPNGDLCEYTEKIDDIRKLNPSTWRASPQLVLLEHISCILFSQILESLAFMHCEAGILHRDIKPDNIGLDENWNIKVFDFGHAIPIPLGGAVQDGICGTNDYASPEARQGLPHNGMLADLWCAGVVLLRLLGFRLRSNPSDWISLFALPLDHPSWQGRFSSALAYDVLRGIFVPEPQRCSVFDVQQRVMAWATDLGLTNPMLVRSCQQSLFSLLGKGPAGVAVHSHGQQQQAAATPEYGQHAR